MPPVPDEPLQVGQPEIIVPEALNAGVYANGLGIWSTQHDFTLDFVINLPPRQAEDDGGNPVVRHQLQVVARVKIPPAMVFNVLQALNEHLTRYEALHGPISGGSGPLFPPPDLDQGGQG